MNKEKLQKKYNDTIEITKAEHKKITDKGLVVLKLLKRLAKKAKKLKLQA